MALVDIDEVAVPRETWKRAQNGDQEAVKALAKLVHGLTLYLHALPVSETEEVIRLRDLESVGIYVAVKVALDVSSVHWLED